MMYRNWHSKTAQDIMAVLNSGETGLSQEEAAKRLSQNGPNKLSEEKTESMFMVFLNQFKSPLIYVLLVAALVVSLIGEVTDGFIIIFVLTINAIVGTFQEGKARKTLKSLKDFSKGQAVVVRGGLEMEINDEELVIGDVLIIRSGDKIPADARLINNQSLKINESALTGESEPVDKDVSVLEDKTEAPDRKNMIYKGSLAVSGSARAVVVSTGENTVIGAISKKLKTIESEVPLKKRVRDLSKIIGLTVLGAAIFVIIVGILKGIPIRDIFFTATAISVSLIPEGLPVAITLILARGVYRMAKKNALVKNMQAVEALGQASVLAVDKTGTITKNELMVERVFVDDKEFAVLGGGYSPKGDILFNGQAVDPANHSELLFAGKVASFCADASVEFLENGEVKVIGDPTEAALLVFGQKIGFEKNELETEEPEVFEIPFSFEHKFHTTLHKIKEDFYLTVVGAPETVLSRVKSVWTSNGERDISVEDRNVINQKIEKFSQMGLRVLCFAVHQRKDSIIDIENIKDICFGGVFAMADVLREEVNDLVRMAKENGVKTVMITGDFLGTAEAIAKKAGIWNEGGAIMSGAELSLATKEEIDHRLENISVFARVLPEHKLTIVESYKRRGDIIGMTGDGVNDALSLSAADLGIAMGRGGTEVAREAADIVLLDNDFKSILSAIEEGRSIYKTIKKVVLYLISTSIGEFLVIAGALLLNLPLPISPSQILWLNLVTDGFMVVALALEPNEPLSGGRNKSLAIMTKADFSRAFMMGLVMMIGTLLMFTYAFNNNNPAVWTISLTLLAVFQWLNAWNCRSDRKSVFVKPFSNHYLLLGLFVTIFLQMFAIYSPFMQNILRTQPLTLTEWLAIIAVAFSIVAVEEVRKLITRLK